MSAQDNGGSAFPSTVTNHAGRAEEVGGELIMPGDAFSFEGMSLRDYFAAKALGGLLAHWIGVRGVGADGYAKRSYEYADAMLKARQS